MPPTTFHIMTASGNKYTKTAHGITSCSLILKAPLGSWQLSLIYLLKLTLHLKERLWESELADFYVFCTHQ